MDAASYCLEFSSGRCHQVWSFQWHGALRQPRRFCRLQSLKQDRWASKFHRLWLHFYRCRPCKIVQFWRLVPSHSRKQSWMETIYNQGKSIGSLRELTISLDESQSHVVCPNHLLLKLLVIFHHRSKLQLVSCPNQSRTKAREPNRQRDHQVTPTPILWHPLRLFHSRMIVLWRQQKHPTRKEDLCHSGSRGRWHWVVPWWLKCTDCYSVWPVECHLDWRESALQLRRALCMFAGRDGEHIHWCSHSWKLEKRKIGIRICNHRKVFKQNLIKFMWNWMRNLKKAFTKFQQNSSKVKQSFARTARTF